MHYSSPTRLVSLAATFSLLLASGHASPPPVISRPPTSPLYSWKEPPPGEVFLHDHDFNDAAYGRFVVQKFKSSTVTVPRVNMMRPFTNCDDGSHIFVTPRGEIVEEATAVIYDASGSLIWTPNADLGQVYNFQVVTYKGDQYLTFWAGNNNGGHGDGYYYMYDKHYNLVRNISAMNGLGADLHSFSITSDGTALLTIYEKVPTDLAGVLGRPSRFEHWMWDCLFQEFDLETGEVIFQWRASVHFEQSESYISHRTATEKEPWDMLHINMVEKDSVGNYLVSLRHMRCIAYVDGKTGKVLWKLGGKANQFEDLSNGDATTFVGQHDAHWDVEQRFVTFFDNRADWQDELEHVSKGRRIEIDTDKMTAKTNMTYVHPEKIFAFSQGSYQTQPNGNVLLGYGYTGALAEFSSDGTLLCDMYLQPSSRFSSGDVQSYRNLKFNWTGLPTTPPSTVLDGRTMFVSWLGSTEVRSWSLQDSFDESEGFGIVLEVPKTGFETEILLKEELALRLYVRLVALDIDKHELASSNVINIESLATVHPEDVADVLEDLDDSAGSEALKAAYALRKEVQLHDLGALLGLGLVLLLIALMFFVGSARSSPIRQWRLQRMSAYEEDLSGNASMWQRFMKRVQERRVRSYEPLPVGVMELSSNDLH